MGHRFRDHRPVEMSGDSWTPRSVRRAPCQTGTSIPGNVPSPRPLSLASWPRSGIRLGHDAITCHVCSAERRTFLLWTDDTRYPLLLESMDVLYFAGTDWRWTPSNRLKGLLVLCLGSMAFQKVRHRQSVSMLIRLIVFRTSPVVLWGLLLRLASVTR